MCRHRAVVIRTHYPPPPGNRRRGPDIRRRFLSLPLLALLAGISLLTACSRLDLAYRNLDWLLAWRIDSYLDLDAEQKAWLKPRISQHLAWHCSTQLPQLADW